MCVCACVSACVCALCRNGRGRCALVHACASITIQQGNSSSPPCRTFLKPMVHFSRSTIVLTHTHIHTYSCTHRDQKLLQHAPIPPVTFPIKSSQPIMALFLLSRCLLQQKHHAHIYSPRSLKPSVFHKLPCLLNSSLC